MQLEYHLAQLPGAGIDHSPLSCHLSHPRSFESQDGSLAGHGLEKDDAKCLQAVLGGEDQNLGMREGIDEPGPIQPAGEPGPDIKPSGHLLQAASVVAIPYKDQFQVGLLLHLAHGLD